MELIQGLFRSTSRIIEDKLYHYHDSADVRTKTGAHGNDQEDGEGMTQHDVRTNEY